MSVDDKVVSASFETTRFVQGISTTIAGLEKLKASLKSLEATQGLDNLEKSSSKVKFLGIGNAIDKLKSKLSFGGPELNGFNEIERASNKVQFLGIGNAIDKLKAKFSFSREADQAFGEVERSSGRVTFSGLGRALDGINAKFSTVQAAAAVAFGNIATGAIQSGIQAAKGLSISPVTDGLKEYETNLNSVQTILSNTAASGAKLKDVNAALNELNHYADKTIYNFSEMAKNIGTFTAAGVDLKTATASIKGIANLAALSGSNSQQASTAMYQLSQAISSGRVSLQDWNSVVNAGMGGTVFQRALAQTAEHLGTIKKGALDLKGPMKNVTIDGKSFRESITAKPGQESWLTSKVLTDTLKQLSGDFTDAELKAQGYSDAQVKAIRSQANMAVKAATQVKTLSGVLDTAKEALGSGWATTWQTIFGDFGEAKTLFTGISNSVNGFISNSAKARNKVLADWKELGGRQAAIEGIKNVFQALGSVLAPLKDAFRDIFPPTTGKQLAELSKRFRDFTENLKIGPETADKLKRSFSGVFAVLDIGKQVVSGIFRVIGRLFGAVGDGSGGFLDLTAKIGDFVTGIDQGLKKGKGLTDFFDDLGSVLQVPIRLLSALGTAIVGLFGGFDKGDADNVNKSLGGMKDSLSPLSGIMRGLNSAWDAFVNGLSALKSQLGPAVSAIGDLGQSLASGLAHTDWSAVFDAIQVGLLGGIFLLVKKFFSKGMSVNIGNGLLGNISEAFETLTGTMKTMQTNIKADTLLKIAAAIGLLTVSVVALSLIDSDGLKKALTAMAVGFGQLLGAMAILTQISGTAGFIKVPVIAASMVLLAGAIDVLVIAVAALSRLDWDELARGLTGVGALLLGVSAAAGPLSANSAGLIRAGVGITAIAVALNLLALAVLSFGHMDWTTIGKGLAGVAGALVVVGSAANLFPTGMVAIGAGLLLVSVGLNALALAVLQFGHMEWKMIGKGLAGIAGALVIIAGAMAIMPSGMVVQAAGLLLVATALNVMGGALRLMGGMSWIEIARGLSALAGSMVILAAGLTAMSGTLGGSAALAVAAASLTLLVPALKVLGGMSWGEIAKGLVALAGAFVVLGVAGIVLAPVAPALLALGAALVLIGGGFTLVGAGLTLISTAISALAIAGPAGIKLLVSSLTQFAEAIPKVVTTFVMGLLAIVQKLAQVAPQFVVALGKILASLVEAVINTAPRLAVAFTAIVQAALSAIRANFPALVTTGIGMLTSLLSGIQRNIGKVTSQVGGIIVNFLNALSSKLPQIIAAGANVLVALLKGVSQNAPKVVKAAADAITGFARGIASNVARVASAGLDVVVHLLSGISSKIPALVAEGGKLIGALIQGIGSAAGKIVAAAVSTAGKFVSTVAKQMVRLADEGAKAIIAFLNGIARVIRQREPEIMAAGFNIGKAVVQGFINGLGSLDISGAVGALKNKIKSAAGSLNPKNLLKEAGDTGFSDLGNWAAQSFGDGFAANGYAVRAAATKASNIVNTVKQSLGIGTMNSSKVMRDLGDAVGSDFAEGIRGSSDDITGAVGDLNGKLNDAMQTLLSTIATENDKLKELRAKKKPDLDAIRETKTALEANKKALEEIYGAHKYLGTALANEKTVLDGQAVSLKTLANRYDAIVTQIDDANKVLDEAIKKHDDFEQSIGSQFSALPDIQMVDKDGNPIDPATQVANWMQALQNQSTAVSTYSDTLEQLRKLGLDDATYQKLLQDGTADQAFASQLLAGGKTAVAGLNALDAQLQKVSGALGTRAANNLYQAGVDSAKGLVRGLQSQQSAIKEAMERIAVAMIKAIKKKLHIRSPSREFARVGAFSTQGLIQGLESSSPSVSDAAERVGSTALEAMRKSLGEASDALALGIDANPTITPVLDLSRLQAEAKQLSDLTNVVPITAAMSYGQAAAISAAQANQQSGSGDDPDSESGGKVLKFIQNNNSPKALSETEIYRQTKNQLSLAQSMLDAM